MAKARKYLSHQEALSKIEHYCGYQERCHQEVRYKLVALGIRGAELEEIIIHLVQEGFLDETRFARAFARGKLRNNQWGWGKIKMELKRRQISDYNLQKAHDEISNEAYLETLQNIMLKKYTLMNDLTPHLQRNKLFNYAYGRGFETELIYDVLAKLVPKK